MSDLIKQYLESDVKDLEDYINKRLVAELFRLYPLGYDNHCIMFGYDDNTIENPIVAEYVRNWKEQTSAKSNSSS